MKPGDDETRSNSSLTVMLWVAGLMLVFAFYVLSVGPVLGYYEREKRLVPWQVDALYSPLHSASNCSEVTNHLYWQYINYWAGNLPKK